jgi:mono/diheme cytochrome c family protein
MNPDPPYLLDATRLWKPRELHWIVENGIKMTGMPAWRDTLSGQQITDVVAYLEAMPQMPPQSYLRWRNAGVCAR